VARVLELRAGGSPMSPGIARIVLNQMRSGSGGTLTAQRRGTSVAEGAQSPLTTRETEVLRLVSRGYSYSEVGDRLGISMHTVTSHIKNSYRKLAVHSGAAAVTRAAELGLLRPGEGNGPAR
jgi:DNA-binding NarL/FixJ family response regulator